jgi:endonuclease/exonuclease/phosphatase family metal-dependent hydrolase
VLAIRRVATLFIALAFASALAACARGQPLAPGTPPAIKLASWNLEWLIAPEAFKDLKETCTRADERPADGGRHIPCDVAARLQRSTRDFRALARYAARLDADVIALQEVDGAAAGRLVFPGYNFCFTSREQIQNNGFAIRAGLAFRCGPDVRDLGARDRLRRGAQLILFPGEPREMHLLSVHLKSGCSRDPLNGPAQACRELARQVPALEAWIDEQGRSGRPFAVLGDFNRDLLGERGSARTPTGALLNIWPELDDADPPEADLVNAAERAPFLNCRPGQSYDAYIDFIVLSKSLGTMQIPGSFERITYSASDARRTRLSDHCPVATRIRLP